jgi:type IV pilus assembly protein PilC
MEASDRTSALASLRARMLHVTGIDRWPGTSSIALLFENIGPVSNRSSVALFRSLAALIRAGVPLRRSIDVAIRQCADSRLKEALNSVLSDIEHGLPLSDGMSRRPKEFPKVFVALIRAGEIGGALDQVLERLASLLERDRTLRKRIASALAYPAVVACAAVALSVFLLASIVPMFSSMYEQMHVPLPLQTSLLIALAARHCGRTLGEYRRCCSSGRALYAKRFATLRSSAFPAACRGCHRKKDVGGKIRPRPGYALAFRRARRPGSRRSRRRDDHANV